MNLDKNTKEYLQAEELAANTVLRKSYKDEDSMIEDRRILEREFYEEIMERRYGCV